MKRNRKALRLNKETIRTMGEVQLGRVHGGIVPRTIGQDCTSPPDPPADTTVCNSAICVTLDCSGNSQVCSLATHCYCPTAANC